MPKEKFPSGVLVHVHEKGWMDEAGTKKWLDEVWGRRNGGMRNEKVCWFGTVSAPTS